MKTAEFMEKESKLKRDNEAARMPAGPTAAHGSSPTVSASGSHITAGQNVYIQSYAHCTLTPSNTAKKNLLLEAIQTKQSPIWGNIPPQHTQFIGRVKLLEYLHTQLDPTDSKTNAEGKTLIISAFKGLGGIGKTQLALEYLRKSEHYRFRVWFQAENITTLKEEYVTLAQSLSDKKFDTEREAIETLKRWFKQNPGWLLVYDNVNTYQDIKALLLEGPGKIILTTRLQRWPNTFKSIEVPTMEDKEASDLILSLIPSSHKESWQKEEKELAILVKTLGNLPLALVQAGSYIKVNQCSIAEYLSDYHKNADTLLQAEALEDSERTVALTWNISLQALLKEPCFKLSMDLICVCAYLSPDNIPKALLSAWMKGVHGLEQIAFRKCLEGLERYSLVKTDESSVSIHRVVQRVVRLQQSGKLVQKDNPIQFPVLNLEWYSNLLIVAHNEFVRETKVLEDELRRQALFPQLQSLKEHYEALGFIDNVAFSNVLLDIGYTLLYQKGDAKTAKIYYERALAIGEQHYGPQHVAVATTLMNLGNAYGDLGDAKQKKELLERALAIQQQYYGPQHVAVAITLCNLAVAEHALGDIQQALHLVDKGYAIFLRDYGEHHAYTKKAHDLKETCQKVLDAPGTLNSTTTTLLISKIPETVSSIPSNHQKPVMNNAKDSSALCDQAPKERMDVKQVAEQATLAVVPTKLATLLATAISNANVPVVNTEVAIKSDMALDSGQAGSNASASGVTVLQKDFILSGAHKVITTGRVVSEGIKANSSSIIAMDKDTSPEVLREIATIRNKSGK